MTNDVSLDVGSPLRTVARWAQEAEDSGAPSPRTMTFATADADGAPHARTVLTTVIDEESVCFHSSTPTTKTTDLAANPRSAGVFFWPSLMRQVIVHGTARELTAADSRAAYPTRPRNLQILAWVYDDLTATPEGVDPERIGHAFDAHAARHPLPMPPSWTTIALVPDRVEFWWGQEPDRAATKVRFERTSDGSWRHHYVLP
jgi:pyridoxamine 5'-phosphate oxidase